MVAEWTVRDAGRALRLPTASDAKYSRGVVGIRTGSDIYPGAAVLGVEAAWLHGTAARVAAAQITAAQITAAQINTVPPTNDRGDAWGHPITALDVAHTLPLVVGALLARA